MRHDGLSGSPYLRNRAKDRANNELGSSRFEVKMDGKDERAGEEIAIENINTKLGFLRMVFTSTLLSYAFVTNLYKGKKIL